jgi:hypothetical protein
MPIELTTTQARKIAQLADELGGEITLHQLADGEDIYVAPVGEENQYRVTADGEVAESE